MGYDPSEIDDLINDVKNLLGEEGEKPAAPRPAAPRQSTVSDETRLYRAPQQPAAAPSAEPSRSQYDGSGIYEWNEPGYTGEYYGNRPAEPEPPRGHPMTQAERTAAARGGTYRAPARTPTRAEAQEAARDEARQAAREERRREERRREAVSREEPRPSRGDRERPRGSSREEWNESVRAAKASVQVADDEDDYEDPIPKKKHKKGWIVLLILLLLGFGVYRLLAKQPMADNASMGARKPGVSTILLAGTDADGTRTDTIMLLNIDRNGRTANLVSIPRDTLVKGGYSVPKINSAYGWAGKGKDGMNELMKRVTECIGFKPDGYVLVNLDSFVSLVNIMGGVNFKVPVNMYYNDPSQNLSINLKAGQQHLDGKQAMGLVRFRSGYAAADLERVNVQRDFVSAAVDQWVSVKNVFRVPRLLAWYASNVTTNMPVSNMTWIGTALMTADKSKIGTQTLPGSATMIHGGSYYVLSPSKVAATVNKYCNPYKKDITVDNLSIRS